MPDYKPGQRFRLTNHHGYDADIAADPNHDKHPPIAAGRPVLVDGQWQVDATHVGTHPLFAGQVGEVEETVPAGVAGAGQLNEEVVVLRFDHRRLTGVKGGEPVHEETGGSRRVSFTDAQMADLFEETK